ncbi:MAG: hypothetical protein QOH35_6040 [Acidobacteriaceae bacterium]|jgi:hypothetical protein|nr:hypothetical protein [Acidobacteriaceae bacterium]
MAAQRAIQAKLPKEARVSIGGEIQMHHLEQAGYKAYRLGQFEDYAELDGPFLATEARQPVWANTSADAHLIPKINL